MVPGVSGLYFVGLHFLFALSSATLIGIGRDAWYVVRAIEARVRGTPRAPSAAQEIRSAAARILVPPCGEYRKGMMVSGRDV